ncbi:hypothetical protein AJ81_08780 [Pseudothermotoga hypogea DSM 11164 = NBRC 106472]|uniref:HEPN domain-containing protein n=1 Tax=Pseudothermotoga hypogea DSM 11164 = NBRC 106472 TaxID=1123384 RepID=A0A0X1KU68_9THEM|nr:hypothetical protein [Pseudothermotoga hypogea]AJC74877.1 hypothetical protein AJ81_08780 [Pseudothermotoga hypogea DSM 11164 = NBRC 106472]
MTKDVGFLKEKSKRFFSNALYLLENELFFDDLSDAYFASRYFPKVFTKNLA